jgi:uncharacterized protein (DUF58 family)
LTTFDNKINHYLPPRNRPGYLHRLMLLLDKEPEGVETDLSRPLRRIADIITRRGLLVLISDLLAPIDELESHLAYLQASGHDMIVFHVLDPAELNFPFETPSLFRDIENNRNFYVDPAEAKEKYQSRLNQHIQTIQSTCQSLGIDYRLMATDRPLEWALLDFLISRSRVSKRIHRNRRMNIRSKR